MRPSSDYFLVQIDHSLQSEKRNNIPTASRAYLGMKFLKIEGKQGLIVHSVDPGSPAEKAGFMMNDVVLGVDELNLATPEQLIEYLYKLSPGKDITVSYISSLSVPNNGHIHVKHIKLAGKKTALEYPEEFRDMAYNLQFGTIRSIGKRARKEAPYAKVGDVLIFDHKVEYKARTIGDHLYNDYHLVGHEGKDELRVVDHSFEVFGVIDMSTGSIIPYRSRVFCHQHFKKSEFQMHNGVWIPEGWDLTMDEMQEKIDTLKEKVQDLGTSAILRQKTNKKNYKKQEEIKKLLSTIREEEKTLTKTMHQARYMELTVLFFNPETAEIIGEPLEAGDKILVDYRTLYPLDINGVYYTLVVPEMIFAKINYDNMEQSKFALKPFSDYVVIMPDEQPKISKGGLHIPDTVDNKPTQGTVMAVGKGTKDVEMEAQVGDRVIYSKHVGTQILWEEKAYLVMKQGQILSAINP